VQVQKNVSVNCNNAEKGVLRSMEHGSECCAHIMMVYFKILKARLIVLQFTILNNTTLYWLKKC